MVPDPHPTRHLVAAFGLVIAAMAFTPLVQNRVIRRRLLFSALLGVAAAALHIARTVCRRAERAMVALAADPNEPVSPPALKYINRLSDLLFVASRYVNDRGRKDVLWVPGQNR